MCKKNTDWLPLVYPQPRTQQQPRHVPKLVTFLLAGLYSTTDHRSQDQVEEKLKTKKPQNQKPKLYLISPER